MSRTVAIAITTLAAFAAACSHADAGPLGTPLGLETLTLIVPKDDPPTPEKVDLGRTLFFDPRLSPTGKMSCSTCHPPEKAWADGLKVSPKFDGTPNKYNTPSVYNVGYLEKLYWDGRAPSLEANITAAWKNQMGGKPDEVAKALAAVPGYATMFQKAFGAPPSETTIARGLAAFLRTLRSGNSPFDRWQVGKQQDAVSNDVKVGYELFIYKAACNACHTPPLFSDTKFHNNGIGSDAENPDPGAGKVQNDPALTGAFKTPSLRNVARTAPYFHDGSVATLREAVKFMAGGGRPNPHLDKQLADRKLTDQEIDQLVAFLQSLSSDEPFTPPAMPQ